MGQKGHKLGTLSGGQYDKSPHMGVGKRQTALTGTAGEGRNNSTPHAGGAIARDGVEGHGGRSRGYQTDAHGDKHHGKTGEAVGHKSDMHQPYDSVLHSEHGSPKIDMSQQNLGANPGFVEHHQHNNGTKAVHHPPVTGKPHEFARLPSTEAHGYGHQPSQRNGWLRSSGHRGAHQVGKRSPS